MGIPAVMMVAAEPSGDRAAAAVASALLGSRPCRLFGAGGPAMERAGVSLVADIDHLSSMGLVDPLAGIGRIARAWQRIRRAVDTERPAAALLVDAPDLNLPLARILKARGVRSVYYIAPQVWAWRRGRLSLLRERVEVTALILPFEPPIFAAAGVPAVYVGHPTLDLPAPGAARRRALRGRLPGPHDQPVVALLPGSRPAECRRHVGPMAVAAEKLAAMGFRPVLAPLPPFSIPGAARRFGLSAPFGARDLLWAADLAVIASGTATLEAAMAGVPHAVVYKTDPLTYLVGRHLLELPYVGLTNWILGTRMVPELLQGEVTGERITEMAVSLRDSSEVARQERAFAAVRRSLGSPGAAARVAALLAERLP